MKTKLDTNGFVIGNYDEKYVAETDLISPVLYNGNFRKPKWNGVDYVEGLTLEEVVLLEEKEIQDVEFFKYLKRKQDGEIAYLKLSAEFRLAKLSGIISEQAHSYLEELLTPVRNEVMFGQWKKGLEILENLGSSQIGIQLYDRLHLQISTYINENY